jgi:hypothetical protein
MSGQIILKAMNKIKQVALKTNAQKRLESWNKMCSKQYLIHLMITHI